MSDNPQKVKSFIQTIISQTTSTPTRRVSSNPLKSIQINNIIHIDRNWCGSLLNLSFNFAKKVELTKERSKITKNKSILDLF